ncbi:MAG: hypothetical protein ACI30A_01775 [Paludibacteraceae bacterium]
MKKFFSLVAVLCVALAASANVVWTETLDKNGTYIDKTKFNNQWPYVDKWYAAGNFVHEYTEVKSYTVSIRGKQLNNDEKNTIGFYFGANKAAASCYFSLKGTIYTAKEGDYLKFELSSPETGSAAEDVATKLIVEINGTALTIPAITVPTPVNTVTVQLPLAAGDITSIKISFDNVAKQKFLTNLRIEDEATAISNIAVAEKAVKVLGEDGQVYIIRNGVKYNALGTVVE